MNNVNSNTGKVSILLITLGFLVLLTVAFMSYINYLKYNQYKIQDFVEEELVNNLHNCKNNILTIPANKIPSSSLGNEYS